MTTAARVGLLGVGLAVSMTLAGGGLRARVRERADLTIEGLSPASRIALERAIGEVLEAHQPVLEGGALSLAGAPIDEHGAHVGRVSIGLAAIGRGGELQQVGSAAPSVFGVEVRIARAPGVTEWWRSLPSGLEQGVTIEVRPEGEGELLLAMDVGHGVTPRLVGAGVVIEDDAGEPLASYAQLLVWDADGARVPARLAVIDRRIAIRVADEGARYPLVVDPLVVGLEATLLPSVSGGEFGRSVSISADGSRAIVGAASEASSRGSAYVFVRSAGEWSEEARLMASGGVVNDRFGSAVAISGDGLRVVVGAPWANGETGEAHVFRRMGTSWSEESVLLPATAMEGFPVGSLAPGRFGASVAISADGSAVVVGAPASDTWRGSVHFYDRTGTSWMTEATRGAFNRSADDRCGVSVAISGDGQWALVGAENDDLAFADQGSVDVYVRSPSGWGRMISEGVPLDPEANAHVGHAVSISSSGARALVGAYFDDAGAGSAYVFGTSAWTQEAKLTTPGGGRFGASVSLSGDGTIALAGPYDGGPTYAFFLEGGSWTPGAEVLAPAPSSGFGLAVSLASSGASAVVGAPLANSAFVYGVGARGLACTVDTNCRTGFCTDGVCCESACGDGATDDCLACSRTTGAITDGTCAMLPITIACRPSAGSCDRAEMCTGASPSCPLDVLASVDTVCLPSSGAPCDVDDRCDGDSPTCPASFVEAGTLCLASSGEVCDAADLCTGTSADCVPTFLEGVECRPSSGGCDPAEVCGSALACPADQRAPGGTVCRASTDLSCDMLESCDGVSSACPLDQNTCEGVDGGLVPVDGGTPPLGAEGCACRAGKSPTSAPLALSMALLTLLLGRRGYGSAR